MTSKNSFTFDYILRKATPADAKALRALIREAMSSYCVDSNISPDILESMHESEEDIAIKTTKRDVLILSAEATGELLGTITLHQIPSPSPRATIKDGYVENVLYISRFAVCNSLRGTGLGVMLIDEAYNIAKSLGLSKLVLHTAITNKGMVDFYIKRGFELVSSDNYRGYERGLFEAAVPTRD